MKSKLYTLLFVLFILMLQGCKTASKLYQKGSYDEAVTLAVKELQKKPDDPQKIALLQNAYSFAVEDHEKKIRNYLAGTNELKWEWVYYQYVDLQNLYHAIRKAPTVYETVKPADYSSFVASYGEKAGEVRFERGLRWLQFADKASAQKAYREFQTAHRFRPGDFEIENMLAEAYSMALTRVVIKPADQFGFMFSNYSNELQLFSDDLVRNLKYGNYNEFVKFYSVLDARSQDIEPDHIIEMQFTDMNMGRFHDRKSTREVTKEVVVKEIVYKPDSIVKVYGTVKAKITTTSRTLFADSRLGFRILDINGSRLWNDHIGSSYTWATEFSTYTGDERALSDEDKKLVGRTPPAAPHESEIIRILKNNIYNDLLYRLKNFYNRY
jgi:hypothetical protein